ncbi:cupin domain-containing protein [Mesorhizobium sp.]|uniref:cupin domain-containing protein n=1 Tax=Mesorhizobium sp. TaxID=1871066 RepID=UPI000FE8E392|nr:cupin domain-containing protein [Mesorhizobium sp.]RWO51566.1 MAG: cupin domain-containing protein [Mesorhizobium sp.]TIN28274.1 MAG: cupin domain-containing protein [Mesorhizobium sp.]TIN34662.1 MAG: cupin domain-containing protein [Mesorhizobium sp.]TJU81306.1 MAG: cupin domain-containing protein [Mesorhizobium sp.]TJU84731.1 MAG: cupin domain-containing protein [Mesorhizobium sp.]
MKPRSVNARRIGILVFSLCALGLIPSAPMAADAKLVVEPVVEKKVKELPPGPLFWRLENFPTLAQAQGAAGSTSLAAEVAGKVWLFTLGPKDGATAGGTNVTEIGPLPSVSASEYLLRINRAGGAPGAKSSIHSHPGPEAFYVLAGKLGQRTPHGVAYAEAETTMVGHGADTPMEVFNAGTTDLDQLAIFVVDANRPFSSPASLD